MASSPVRFKLLGPLELFDGQRWDLVGAPKQRALLAVLLTSSRSIRSVPRPSEWVTHEEPAPVLAA